ncbi:MAG: hypothetical protein HW380_2391 [Magnetococcales bacterium]|nr:hypothetical protein [Magnetococcales bacterium]
MTTSPSNQSSYQHTPPSPPSKPVRGLYYRECAEALAYLPSRDMFGSETSNRNRAVGSIWRRSGRPGIRCGTGTVTMGRNAEFLAQE